MGLMAKRHDEADEVIERERAMPGSDVNHSGRWQQVAATSDGGRWLCIGLRMGDLLWVRIVNASRYLLEVSCSYLIVRVRHYNRYISCSWWNDCH
ncbi:hypothetical protein EUGRSUZ_F00157 [Eucalyptus grandis]|uniref:Uncharacterized protein n=2 Tax=Eucalyptus grandis TaxID=71139 RepID=A0ACC3KB27_EUCGR|nr:hypothetical protein EUGRSUZ_F00157 [Eucalyptus grandis]